MKTFTLILAVLMLVPAIPFASSLYVNRNTPV